MKTVEIENRTNEGKDINVLMVDLIIDGQKIDTGNNPVTSYSFWEDISEQSQRALHRIKKNNPKMKFDFDLSSMMLTEEEKNQRFIKHVKSKHADIDVDKVMELIDKEFSKVELTGPDENHPNPFMKFPLNGQLTKMFIVSVIDEFLKENK